jgi:hypothetical protein
LSRVRMGVLQSGQREPGLTIDLCCGRRLMQTFRKLPNASPKRTTKMAISRTVGLLRATMPA